MVKKIIKENPNTHGRTCAKCNKKVVLSQYYTNAENKEWQFKDKWCKDCVRKYVKDIHTLKEYCHFNNRVFSEDLFTFSYDSIQEQILNNDEYDKIKDLDKKEAYRNDRLFRLYFKQMNMAQYYAYENNNFNTQAVVKDMEKEIHDKKIATRKEELDNSPVIWNHDWFGNYTQTDIDYLDEYFNNLKEQTDISDIHQEKAVREVAKASLEVAKAGDEMRSGKNGSSTRYKNAVDIFVKLSDNTKLSASKKSTDRSGFGDISSLIKQIAVTGALMKEIKLPEDDIDYVLKDFEHTLRSFDGESLTAEVHNDS